MSLLSLIDKLKILPPTSKVFIKYKDKTYYLTISPDAEDEEDDYPKFFHSYRGYYEDLSVSIDSYEEDIYTVKQFLAEAERAARYSFPGYKGGLYTMTQYSTLWFSTYGEASGLQMDDIIQDGDKIIISLYKNEDDY